MIRVLVIRREDQKIREVIIEGHAGYGDPGEDLVCAAVSAVTFGTANAIEALLSLHVVKQVGESGFLHFALPEIEDQQTLNNVQLLMEAMLVSLQTIKESYTENGKNYSEYMEIREIHEGGATSC